MASIVKGVQAALTAAQGIPEEIRRNLARKMGHECEFFDHELKTRFNHLKGELRGLTMRGALALLLVLGTILTLILLSALAGMSGRLAGGLIGAVIVGACLSGYLFSRHRAPFMDELREMGGLLRDATQHWVRLKQEIEKYDITGDTVAARADLLLKKLAADRSPGPPGSAGVWGSSSQFDAIYSIVVQLAIPVSEKEDYVSS